MSFVSKVHSMGKDNYQWRMTVLIEQNRDSYKYTLSDLDEQDQVKTGWLSVKLSIIVDEALVNIVYHADRFITITDVMDKLNQLTDRDLFHYETEDKPL